MKRTENGKCLQITIDTAADGMKLEQYLRQKLQFTKAQIKSMKFREKGLMIDGIRVRISHILKVGERLEVMLEEANASSAHLVQAEEPIQILYENDDLIAVWKEPGLVMHPSHGHFGDTLSNRVHAYFAGQNTCVTIRSIGRLDRDTGGIVVFAKNQVAAARLWEQKENGIFWKEYLAIYSGVPEADIMECAGRYTESNHVEQAYRYREADTGKGSRERNVSGDVWHTIFAPIGRLPGDRMRMCVAPEGKRAVTHYQVLAVEEEKALIRVRIETGRTHQIRVHMAFIGHPLVGDILYGKGIDADDCVGENDHVSMDAAEKLQETRTNAGEVTEKKDLDEKEKTRSGKMYLCAWKVELVQPFTGKPLRFMAEHLDSKMEKAVSCLEKKISS